MKFVKKLLYVVGGFIAWIVVSFFVALGIVISTPISSSVQFVLFISMLTTAMFLVAFVKKRENLKKAGITMREYFIVLKERKHLNKAIRYYESKMEEIRREIQALDLRLAETQVNLATMGLNTLQGRGDIAWTIQSRERAIKSLQIFGKEINKIKAKVDNIREYPRAFLEGKLYRKARKRAKK